MTTPDPEVEKLAREIAVMAGWKDWMGDSFVAAILPLLRRFVEKVDEGERHCCQCGKFYIIRYCHECATVHMRVKMEKAEALAAARAERIAELEGQPKQEVYWYWRNKAERAESEAARLRGERDKSWECVRNLESEQERLGRWVADESNGASLPDNPVDAAILIATERGRQHDLQFAAAEAWHADFLRAEAERVKVEQRDFYFVAYRTARAELADLQTQLDALHAVRNADVSAKNGQCKRDAASDGVEHMQAERDEERTRRLETVAMVADLQAQVDAARGLLAKLYKDFLPKSDQRKAIYAVLFPEQAALLAAQPSKPTRAAGIAAHIHADTDECACIGTAPAEAPAPPAESAFVTMDEARAEAEALRRQVTIMVEQDLQALAARAEAPAPPAAQQKDAVGLWICDVCDEPHQPPHISEECIPCHKGKPHLEGVTYSCGAEGQAAEPEETGEIKLYTGGTPPLVFKVPYLAALAYHALDNAAAERAARLAAQDKLLDECENTLNLVAVVISRDHPETFRRVRETLAKLASRTR